MGVIVYSIFMNGFDWVLLAVGGRDSVRVGVWNGKACYQ